MKDCTIKIFGYNTRIMDDFSPIQLIILCSVFIGFHLLALPAFLWSMRHRQFLGREQKNEIWIARNGLMRPFRQFRVQSSHLKRVSC